MNINLKNPVSKKASISLLVILGFACTTTGDDVWESSEDLLSLISGIDEVSEPVVGVRLDKETKPLEDDIVPLNPNHVQVRFRFNSVKLNKQSVGNLGQLARKLEVLPKAKVYLRASMTRSKLDSYNMYLSRKRTRVIESFLVKKGISRQRIRILPIGVALLDDRNIIAAHRKIKSKDFYLNFGDGVFNN